MPKKEQRRRPRLSASSRDVLAAFYELSGARQYIGMAGAAAPIPFGQIAEYARLRGWADPLVFDRFSYLIRSLDVDYMRRANEKIGGGGGLKSTTTTTRTSNKRAPTRRRR